MATADASLLFNSLILGYALNIFLLLKRNKKLGVFLKIRLLAPEKTLNDYSRFFCFNSDRPFLNRIDSEATKGITIE